MREILKLRPNSRFHMVSLCFPLPFSSQIGCDFCYITRIPLCHVGVGFGCLSLEMGEQFMGVLKLAKNRHY